MRTFKANPQLLHRERYKQEPRTPPGREKQKLQLAIFVWATFNQAQPSNFTALEMVPAEFGYNWILWRTVLQTRILARGGNPANEIHEVGGSVHLTGEAVIDLCSMADLCILGHWLPKEMTAAIKARSTAPGGTKVYFWIDWESWQQAIPWLLQKGEIISLLKDMGDFGRGVLAGVGTNSWSCTLIDKYELPWQPGQVICPHLFPSHGQPTEVPDVGQQHTMDMDTHFLTGGAVANSSQALSTLATYLDVFLRDWTGADGKLAFNGLMFDNLLTFPFKGVATNNYPTDWPTKYVNAWKAFFSTWDTRLIQLQVEAKIQTKVHWVAANGPETGDVYGADHCQLRYIEHFFRTPELMAKTRGEISESLHQLRVNNLSGILALNGTQGQVTDWAFGPGPGGNRGTWEDVQREITRLELKDRVYVAAWQGFGGGYVFWQEQFRMPS